MQHELPDEIGPPGIVHIDVVTTYSCNGRSEGKAFRQHEERSGYEQALIADTGFTGDPHLHEVLLRYAQNSTLVTKKLTSEKFTPGLVQKGEECGLQIS